MATLKRRGRRPTRRAEERVLRKAAKGPTKVRPHDAYVQRQTTDAEAGAEAGVDLVWDDEEERRYREWVKLKVQENDQPDFDEFRQEEAFRQKLRDETKSRKNDEASLLLLSKFEIFGVDKQ